MSVSVLRDKFRDNLRGALFEIGLEVYGHGDIAYQNLWQSWTRQQQSGLQTWWPVTEVYNPENENPRP